jgi:sulfotransferase family protein
MFNTVRPLKSVTFICGCGHSGTSLIANMMAAHTETYVPLRETNTFLRPAAQALTRYQYLKLQAKASGKRHLVEKTPRHVDRLAVIRVVAPTARFIMPVRDGRDVVASIVRRGRPTREAIARWIRDNEIVRQQQARADTVVYRHEDLISDPTRTLERICAGAGIPYQDQLLSYHEKKRLWFGVEKMENSDPHGAGHERHRNWQINQPIFDNRGRWKEELTSAELTPLVHGPGRRLMEAFGYLEDSEAQTREAPADA